MKAALIRVIGVIGVAVVLILTLSAFSESQSVSSEPRRCRSARGPR
jgi:hypothetical protein